MGGMETAFLVAGASESSVDKVSMGSGNRSPRIGRTGIGALGAGECHPQRLEDVLVVG